MKAGSIAQGAWGQMVLAVVMMVSGAFGQTAADLGEGLRAELTTTAGVTAIKWWGKAGRTYFVQSSETLLSGSWQYMPVVEAGADGVCTWNLQTSASKMFVRLVYTDQLFSGSSGAADFDGDGLSNALEVSITGPHTNPFLADTDWDGYSDGAEVTAGTLPTSSQSNANNSPAGSGPLNPDGRYRHGIRLDYAHKNMWAEYEGSLERPGIADAHHTYAGVYTWSGSTNTFVLGPLHDYSADRTSDALASWNSTAFPEPATTMFDWVGGQMWIDGMWSEYTSTTSSGKWVDNDTERQMLKMKAVVSPGAPAWARRSVAVVEYLGGTSTGHIVKEGRLTLSGSNAQASDGISRHLVTEAAGQGSAVVTPKIAANERRQLQLLDVDIAPGPNMAGVIGDVVPSVNAESLVRHFVTPKKSTELPQDYVELTAGTVSTTKFDELFEWEGGVESTGGSTTRRVSRATTGDKATIVKIITKKTKTVVSEMHVWVVWATCTPTLRTASWDIHQIPTGQQILVFGTWQPEMVNGGRKWWVPNFNGSRHRFVFTIQPAQICDRSLQERPDLEGVKKTNPPGRNETHSTTGLPADDALYKWDVSRQMQVRILNPNLIPRSELEKIGTSWFVNQPVTSDVPDPWPQNPVAGNDDPPSGDEDDNPYDARQGFDLDHGVGQLSSIDAPSLPALDSWASSGAYFYFFGTEVNFREFCRLEITDGARTTEPTWFKISDDYSWHHYLRASWDGFIWYDAYSSWGAGHSAP